MFFSFQRLLTCRSYMSARLNSAQSSLTYSEVYLKACVCYFHQFFIFSPNDNPLKTMKKAFYFI